MAGEVMVIREDGLAPSKWSISRVEAEHPEYDGKVLVVDICTTKGVYCRPVAKVAPLLYQD